FWKTCRFPVSPIDYKVSPNVEIEFHISMNVKKQIQNYISGQPEPKRSDMETLHRVILQAVPECKYWFLDGKNSENKTVANPNIGYGLQAMKYKDGTTRDFYQIGLSA